MCENYLRMRFFCLKSFSFLRKSSLEICQVYVNYVQNENITYSAHLAYFCKQNQFLPIVYSSIFVQHVFKSNFLSNEISYDKFKSKKYKE